LVKIVAEIPRVKDKDLIDEPDAAADAGTGGPELNVNRLLHVFFWSRK